MDKFSFSVETNSPPPIPPPPPHYDIERECHRNVRGIGTKLHSTIGREGGSRNSSFQGEKSKKIARSQFFQVHFVKDRRPFDFVAV